MEKLNQCPTRRTLLTNIYVARKHFAFARREK